MLSKMPIVGAVIVRADDMNEGPVAVGMNAEAPPSSMMIKDGVIQVEKTGFLANLRPENEDFRVNCLFVFQLLNANIFVPTGPSCAC